MNTLRIAGIDLGTDLGITCVCLHDDRSFVPSDIVHSAAYSLETYVMLHGAVGRWIGLTHLLNEHLAGSDYLYYEQVYSGVHKGGNASHIYGGFEAHILYWAHTLSIPIQGINIQKTKVGLTNDPGASKAKMVKFGAVLLGYMPTKDQADSLGVVLAGIQLIRKH